MRKLFLAITMILLIASVLLSGCTQSAATSTTAVAAPSTTANPVNTTTSSPVSTAATSASTSTPQSGGIVRYLTKSVVSSPIGWPPEITWGSDEPMGVVGEGLVQGMSDGSFKGLLATDWTVADDGKSITFNLRKGVKFHDGSDFNAEVAKFNMDAQQVAKISGTANWDSVEIIDDYTIRINLKKYDNSILYGLNLRMSDMVSKEANDKNGLDWVRKNPIGTGPMKFVSFQQSVSAKFERFDDYWGGKPYLDGVEIQYIADATTQNLAFLSGGGEIIFLGGGNQDKTKSDLLAKGYILEPPIGGGGMIVMNPSSANPDSPLANVKVRQAIDYAIDREGIAKGLGFGCETAAYQAAPQGNMGYVSGLARKYDPARAKQLLAEAGYPDGFTTTLYVPTMTISADFGAAVAANLQAVGITANQQNVNATDYVTLSTKGWEGFLFNPPITKSNFAWECVAYYKPGITNYISLDKPAELGNLIDAALSARDYDSQYAADQNIGSYMFDNATVCPITSYLYGEAVTVTNLHDAGLGNYMSSSDWDIAHTWLSQ